MKNITLAIDEALLEEGRRHAASLGLSLNGLVRDLLQQATRKSHQKTNWAKDLFARIDKLKIKPKKITWTRDELHER